jgi:expansin (peptidoglycan-binding protein)
MLRYILVSSVLAFATAESIPVIQAPDGALQIYAHFRNQFQSSPVLTQTTEPENLVPQTTQLPSQLQHPPQLLQQVSKVQQPPSLQQVPTVTPQPERKPEPINADPVQIGSGTPGKSLSPQLLGVGDSMTAKATEYGGNTNGACGMAYNPPSGFGAAAVSVDMFADSAACGTCMQATYGSVTKTIMIVDECPDCHKNGPKVQEDLFLDTWKDLAAGKNEPLSKGILDGIEWKSVSCGLKQSLQLKWKEGSNDEWAALSVRHSNLAVVKMSIQRIDGSQPGPWVELELRKDMACFTMAGSQNMPGKLFNVQLTSMDGQVKVLENVVRLKSDQDFGFNF